MSGRKPWKKNLYENQDYPDNYTDKTFLVDLRRNIEFQEVSLLEAILGAALLTQELCTVLAFVLVYVYMYNEWTEPNMVFFISSVATAFSFIIYRAFFCNEFLKIFRYDLRTLLIFLVFGHLFSPILHTLTDTISTDTIYMATFFMMLVHLIFFDYGVPAAIVSRSLSQSAAVFGSVCLASRLASAYHAFVLMTISIECFVLFPLLREKLSKSLTVTSFLIVWVVCVLLTISAILAVCFILVLGFINIVCPILFTRYQKYKDNIYGPWDEAVVHDADNISDLIYSL